MRTLTALAATLLATAATALNVTVPDSIAAGAETEIAIGFDSWKQPFAYEHIREPIGDVKWAVCRNPADEEVGCGHDMLYEHYQLFLWTDEWMYTCYLSGLIPMGTANPKITIPKDLGPSERYRVTAMAFNGTKPETNYYGVANSDPFLLTSTDVKKWTQWEHYGGWLKPWYSLPCSSYGCYRTCGLKFADEKGNKKQGTAAGLYNCLNECPGIRADWSDSDSQWSWYKAFDGVDWSGESTAVTTSTPSAITTSGWSTTMDIQETTLYGTPTTEPGLPTNTRGSAAASRTATSAGKRRARPVALKGGTGTASGGGGGAAAAGGILMTVVVCLVFFAFGTLIGWIWPDGLRSDW
ncbi:hypothetical protein CMUS01_06044 [Colletotrichum musicola]|uniref:CFEM domain-containing protein n=1 Tax=Colletotrichum musicola TaxID=2175873 RepID=A0A8H6NJ57_9PEZI|nr:hypothetical protein CMUS01_06044 [Colletotrichum musicola]